ncbi:CD40 ligand [Eucyclogobius newberryi]|uniref:CD40 ligand n=1 Tax=Eucyclogobius newberryi TaxID=166745 RepID=UPI003B5CD4D2
MINTHHSSVAPPPVPPRLHSSSQGAQPVLIPTTMLPQGHSRNLMRFMVALVLLNLLLSMFGFFYLYRNGTPQSKQDMPSSYTGAGPEFSMQKQHTEHSHHVEKRASHRVFAQMEFLRPTRPHKSHSGHLIWNIKHSKYSIPHVNYYNNSWLTIEEPGHYFVYSRVTFSNGLHTKTLMNQVQLRKSTTDKPRVTMQAFCHTQSSLCTATAEGLIRLEKGNQLSVWTEDVSLVNYYEGATAFGLYNLL